MINETNLYSSFGNRYGKAALINDTNQRYLKIDDCFGKETIGPLTEDQVNSFYDLCEENSFLYE